MTTRALLVLAAGMGSRYGGLKQMDPVGPSNETIIDYSIYDAVLCGFEKLVFVIRREMESAFRKAIGNRYESAVDVTYVHQELDALPAGFTVPADREKPWGTGHALLVARDALESHRFAVINADDFYGRGSYKAVADFLAGPPTGAVAEYGLVGFELRRTLSENGTVARGICTAENGYLASIEEMTKISKTDSGAVHANPDGTQVEFSGDELVSMNMWGLLPSVFDCLEDRFSHFLTSAGTDAKTEFYIPTFMDELIKAGIARCRILPTNETWSGITYREDKPLVIERIRSLVASGVYTSPLELPS